MAGRPHRRHRHHPGLAAVPLLIDAGTLPNHHHAPLSTYGSAAQPARPADHHGGHRARGLQNARIPVRDGQRSLANIVLSMLFVGACWGSPDPRGPRSSRRAATAAIYLCWSAPRNATVSRSRPPGPGCVTQQPPGSRCSSHRVACAVLVVTTAIAARLGDPEIAAHQMVFQLVAAGLHAGRDRHRRPVDCRPLPEGLTPGAAKSPAEWWVGISAPSSPLLVLAVRPAIHRRPACATHPRRADRRRALQPLSGVVMVLDGS